MSAKNRNAIKRFSGGNLQVLRIADEVVGGESTDTGWVDMGYVESSVLSDTTEIEEIKDETGNVVNADESERTVKLTGLLMQTDKATIDFLKETVRGNYYMVWHNAGSSHDGTNAVTQEHVFGICQIKPMIEIESGTRRIPFEITVLYNASQIDYNDTDEVQLPTDTSVTNGQIDAGAYYTIEEN